MDYIMAAGLLFVGWVVQEFGDLFRKKGHYGKSPEYKDTYFRGELTWGGRFICAVGSGIMATGAGFLVIFVISLAGCAITMTHGSMRTNMEKVWPNQSIAYGEMSWLCSDTQMDRSCEDIR